MKQAGRNDKQSGSDRELVRSIQAGDDHAFPVLLERYLPVLQARASRYSSIVGVDVEDFIQEGMLALYRAARRYDFGAGAQFGTYAAASINNAMSTAVKAHMKLFRGEGISLDGAGGSRLLEQTRQILPETPPEEAYFQLEQSGLLARQIETLLSKFERQVLTLYLRGHTYQQTARVLSTTTKAVDNALQRVRRKLRPEL